MLKLDLSKDLKTVRLTLGKKFTSSSSREINNYISKLLLRSDVNILIIDLKNIKVLSPTAYNSFVKLKWIMKLRKGVVYFENVNKIFVDDLNKLHFRIKKESVIL